jgi:hypothetical protein
MTLRCPDCKRSEWPFGPHSPHNAEGTRATRSCSGEPVTPIEYDDATVLATTLTDPAMPRQLYGAEVWAVPSASTDTVHLVTGHEGAWACSGPYCRGRTCRHIREVLTVRASS